MSLRAIRKVSGVVIVITALFPLWSKAEMHPLDSVPAHFITSGHFSTQPQGAWSPTMRMARDEIAFPLTAAVVSGFSIGFVHRFLADRLKYNWVPALGWPLLNMTGYLMMRPGSRLRVLPSLGDFAMTAALGDQWAGNVTPWIRAANTLYTGVEAVWPELQTEFSAFFQCKTQPVIVEGSQSPADLTILTCPETQSVSNYKPALMIEFPPIEKEFTGTENTASSLIKSLYQLRKNCINQSISRLILAYEHLADGRLQLKAIPFTDSGWQKPVVLDIDNSKGEYWWADINLAEVAEGKAVVSPLTASLVKGVMAGLSHPEQSHTVQVSPERLQHVAGLLTLPQDGDAFWFRSRPASVLPGTYQHLPEVVFTANVQWKGSHPEVEKFRQYSLIPENMKLPWKVLQLSTLSLVRGKSVDAAARLARFVEEAVVLPGTLLGTGYFPESKIPFSIQTLRLETVPGFGISERVFIETADGHQLGGLLIRSRSKRETHDRTLHIHYHGNGDSCDLAGWSLFHSLTPDDQSLAQYCSEHGVDILIPEYRGFRNDLEPVNGQTLLDDANRFYQLLSNQYQRVTVSGVSLGSGMAAWVAAQNNPDAVVLLSPFTSLARAAGDMLMGVKIPKWLLKFNMETDQNIQAISEHTKIYLRHGQLDKITRPQNTEDLHEILKASNHNDVDVDLLEGVNHNDILKAQSISDVFATVWKGGRP
ncbi:alpha/beta hydrolase [Sansalvadorimonas verongulae]|uniref:alpha/beta hydrolase n=1 Tax=Sansalvadorimonas verongulae TaxID=2172824 RepID=UPI001E424B9B|nr:hypothetical protein [Sansalvadorimonas verongulae]MTI12867.1 hypothetical protein [Sansalvadorimonas verongulae]